MNSLNMRMYEDGSRTILVFNNLAADSKEVLSQIINSITGNCNEPEQIDNVVPIYEDDEPMPDIPEETVSEAMYRMIRQDGFDGFIEADKLFRNNAGLMTAEEYNKAYSLICRYLQQMASTDPAALDDAKLYKAVKFLYEGYYANRLATCLGCLGLDSLDMVLNAGRPYLESAYRICFEQ